MTPNLRNRRRGSSTLEFTLVGIPIIFVLISTFEMARGMWNYHTIAYAVKEGTRFASVHGIDCSTAPNTENRGCRYRAAYQSAQADVYLSQRFY
jgi:Flp pilus assembly protein TadG